MKTKILSIFLLLFFGAQFAFAGPEDCVVSPQGGSDIKDVLKKCQSDGSVKIDKGGDDITSVKIYVKGVAETLIAYGALFAIGALVMSGIMYTIAYGDESKITTAKNIAIYSLIGLVLLITAFPLVGIIVDFIYGLGSSSQ